MSACARRFVARRADFALLVVANYAAVLHYSALCIERGVGGIIYKVLRADRKCDNAGCRARRDKIARPAASPRRAAGGGRKQAAGRGKSLFTDNGRVIQGYGDIIAFTRQCKVTAKKFS